MPQIQGIKEHIHNAAAEATSAAGDRRLHGHGNNISNGPQSIANTVAATSNPTALTAIATGANNINSIANTGSNNNSAIFNIGSSQVSNYGNDIISYGSRIVTIDDDYSIVNDDNSKLLSLASVLNPTAAAHVKHLDDQQQFQNHSPQQPQHPLSSSMIKQQQTILLQDESPAMEGKEGLRRTNTLQSLPSFSTLFSNISISNTVSDFQNLNSTAVAASNLPTADAHSSNSLIQSPNVSNLSNLSFSSNSITNSSSSSTQSLPMRNSASALANYQYQQQQQHQSMSNSSSQEFSNQYSSASQPPAPVASIGLPQHNQSFGYAPNVGNTAPPSTAAVPPSSAYYQPYPAQGNLRRQMMHQSHQHQNQQVLQNQAPVAVGTGDTFSTPQSYHSPQHPPHHIPSQQQQPPVLSHGRAAPYPSITSGPITPSTIPHGSPSIAPGSDSSSPNAQQSPAAAKKRRQRRKFEQVTRLYQCNYGKCSKSYGSLNHLNHHIVLQNHGPKRTIDEFQEKLKDAVKAGIIKDIPPSASRIRKDILNFKG